MSTATLGLARPSRAPAPSLRACVRWTMRTGRSEDAHALHGLILDNLQDGHLLPRRLDDLRAHAHRFVVIRDDATIVAGAELAPLSPRVAEVRSLVVAAPYRGAGLGRALVTEVRNRAARAGHTTLCAFTHEPGLFLRLGFAIVPHASLPEKIARDCRECDAFGRCGQVAMWLRLHPEASERFPARAAAAEARRTSWQGGEAV